MIAIVDYGLGNLRSVAGAIKRLGYETLITNKPKDLRESQKLILPGVGAFGEGMNNLNRLGLTDLLNTLVVKELKPILGICLGSQLMARESYEFGHHQGLGWIDATVAKIEAVNGLRVPHVGWDDLLQIKEDNIFEGIPKDAPFYYVHSFYINCDNPKIIIGECEYGIRFSAAFHQNNIYGVQFHPEKSQMSGLRLLGNFLAKG